MKAALHCSALSRRLVRSQLWALEAFAAIVSECAAERVARGQSAAFAHRNALNDTLDLIRAGMRAKATAEETPHHD